MHQSHFELWSLKHLGCHLQIPSLTSIFSVSPPSLLNCKSHQKGESGLHHSEFTGPQARVRPPAQAGAQRGTQRCLRETLPVFPIQSV